MKPGHKLRYPGGRSVWRALETLARAIPTDDAQPFQLSWRASEAGNPNLRCTGLTQGLTWYVDIYSGRFYRVVVGDQPGEVWRNLPGLVQYMRHELGLLPIGAE